MFALEKLMEERF